MIERFNGIAKAKDRKIEMLIYNKVLINRDDKRRIDLSEDLERAIRREVRPLLDNRGGKIKSITVKDGTATIEVTWLGIFCCMREESVVPYIESIIKSRIKGINDVEVVEDFSDEIKSRINASLHKNRREM
jgi:Fe-S cluster biogenesis protein NfuA